MTRNAGLAVVAAIVVIAAGYGLQLGLGRAVVPAEFAFLQETLAFYMMAMLPLQPIGAVVTKQSARHEDRLWTRLTQPTVVAVLVLATVAVYLASRGDEPLRWTAGTAAMFLLAVATGLGFLITNSMAIGRLDFIGSTIIQSVQAFVRVSLALPLVWAGAGAQGLWCATAVANGSAALCARWRLAAPSGESPVAGGPLHQKRDFGIAACCYAGIALLTQIDLIYAHRSFPGIPTYAGAALFGKLVFYLPAAASTVALPLLARVQPGASTRRVLRQSMLLVGAVAAACFAGVAALGDVVAGRLLGEQYQSTGGYIFVSAAAMLPYSIVNLLASASLAAGRIRFAWVTTAVAGAVTLLTVVAPLTLTSLSLIIGLSGILLVATGAVDSAFAPANAEVIA